MQLDETFAPAVKIKKSFNIYLVFTHVEVSFTTFIVRSGNMQVLLYRQLIVFNKNHDEMLMNDNKAIQYTYIYKVEKIKRFVLNPNIFVWINRASRYMNHRLGFVHRHILTVSLLKTVKRFFVTSTLVGTCSILWVMASYRSWELSYILKTQAFLIKLRKDVKQD